MMYIPVKTKEKGTNELKQSWQYTRHNATTATTPAGLGQLYKPANIGHEYQTSKDLPMSGLHRTIFLIVLMGWAVPTWAQEYTPSPGAVVLQVKYAPWGFIDADEDEFALYDNTYQKYDMHFERSIGARLIASPFYISLQENITQIDHPIPDAKVRTFSAGFAGIVHNPEIFSSNTYIIGALGLGHGSFRFKDPLKDDDEYFFEGNAEFGLQPVKHWLIGIGIDWQHFGRPGESKANYWNLYLSTGLTFD
ncbi:hypothetical protein [Cellvibrio japonicus]|nr:hypothetical protein [Cellvibrio japonicus]QEI11615.1 hypothetical protein FY117_04820 [Cellvibrio japonicus]QEI15189.1 hypothetical protein FY116_04820 [Cellvibrio japonicus]QEI18769.1 hypothetical protein FY115_04820 [Cellvibrio japonicus]